MHTFFSPGHLVYKLCLGNLTLFGIKLKMGWYCFGNLQSKHLQCPWAFRNNEGHRIKWQPYSWTLSEAPHHLGCSSTHIMALESQKTLAYILFYTVSYQISCSLVSRALCLLFSSHTSIGSALGQIAPHIFLIDMIDLPLGVLLGWNLLFLIVRHKFKCLHLREGLWLSIPGLLAEKAEFWFFSSLRTSIGYLDLVETGTD